MKDLIIACIMLICFLLILVCFAVNFGVLPSNKEIDSQINVSGIDNNSV